MAYMQAIGQCMNCHQMFSFNPDRVPSIWVNGSREPVCKACIERANPIRIAKGLEPLVILPGAYEPEECY